LKLRPVRLPRELGLFAIGGVGGLLVDAGIVQALVSWAGWNAYLARGLSFLAAATFTWGWNRRYTFAGRGSGRAAHAEWLHWIALMGFGALINLGVYVGLLMAFAPLHHWPAVAVAGGALVAAVVNFSVARGMLFRGAETHM